MIEINAKIDGMDTLIKGLKQAPEKTIEYASDAIKRSIAVLQSSAIKEAPVNKQFGGGNLRQNIRSSLINKLKGVVVSGAQYSIFVHEGTRPHEIRVKQKQVLANKRTGEFFGRVVRHPGTQANPFMQRAYDKNIYRINQLFMEVVDKVAKLITK